MKPSKVWTLILACLWLSSLLLQPGAQPAEASPIAPVVIRLYVRDKAHLNAVASELDIWEVHRDAGYVVAAVTPEQLHWLRQLGYQTEVDPQKTVWLYQDRAALDPRYYYFSAAYPNPNQRHLVNFLQDTHAAYAGLTELFNLGNAWQGSRGIWVLRITNEDPAFGPIEDKPAFFLYATIHAREVATPELAIRYIKYLLEGYNGEGGYGVDADATWLVDQHVLYVLVMANPDGHVVNEMNTSANRRKNMNNTLCSTGNFGVDLNRNHSFLWACCGGSSSNSCTETYRGSSRASEPETQAFQNFFASVMRDQNGNNGDDQIPPAAPENTMGIFITLHSYSDLVLWPWGFSNYGNSPNFTQLQAIGQKFAYFNNYNPNGTIWYDVDGATDDWTYGKFGIASFTFEVGPSSGACSGFFPAYGCVDGIDGMPRNFWAENKPAFIYAHKIAAAPYRIVYGPDTLNVTVSPASTLPQTSVVLQATIADRRYQNVGLRPIAAAEYFIGAPGADGSGTPMAPADGAWGSTSELVRATLDTGALTPGRHTLFVHGRNDLGRWGPFSAVFLDIETPPSCTPLTDATLNVLTPAPIYTDTLVTFEAMLSPTAFTPPYTYTLDFGAGPGAPLSGVENPLTGLSHIFTSTGTHTVTLTLWNCSASTAISATATVEVTAPPAPPLCTPLTDATLNVLTPAPIYTDTLVTFEAMLSPTAFTPPYTYTLDFGAGPGDPLSGVENPLTGLSHIFTSTGTHTVTLTLWNCSTSAAISATTTVEVTAPPAPPTYGILLTPTIATQSAFPGTSVTYTLAARNTGNITTTFDFGTAGAEVWPTSLSPITSTLAAGEALTITVTVTLPSDATGSDSVTVIASSRTQPPVTAQATLQTMTIPLKRLYLPLLLHAPRTGR